MWLAPLLQVLLLAAAAPAAGGQPPAAAPASVPTFYSREARFAIPYHLNRPARVSHEAVEVQLYFSADHGGAWQFYDKVNPAAARFLFRAPSDGEYWFTVRTVDHGGQPSAVGGPNAAQLIVVVDTTPPKVQISGRHGPTGETIVHWQIEELHPKPGSLSLQYRADATMPWTAVKFDRPEPGAIGPRQSGEVVLYPPSRVTQLELRGEVLDLAGNTGVGQVKINLRDLEPPTTWPASKGSAPGEAAGVGRRPSRPARCGPCRGKRAWKSPSGAGPTRKTAPWRCKSTPPATISSSPWTRGMRPTARRPRVRRRRQARWPARRRPPFPSAKSCTWSTPASSSWNTISSPWGPRASSRWSCGGRATAGGPGSDSPWTRATTPWS